MRRPIPGRGSLWPCGPWNADLPKTGILLLHPHSGAPCTGAEGQGGQGDVSVPSAMYPRIAGFLEKPNPADTPSRYACPCFYYLHRHALPHLHAFLAEQEGRPLDEYDATGKFIAYLISRVPVHAYPISGRLDIGNLPSYLEACAYLRGKEGTRVGE